VFDREHQQIAAVSRASGNLDLFVIGNDNHIWTTYWSDQASWSADWLPPVRWMEASTSSKMRNIPHRFAQLE
jgi:hypothetical protein